MNYNGYSINVVREHNLKIITRLLYKEPLSCKELSKTMGLSETAIKKNITQLLSLDVVKVYEEEPSNEKKHVGGQHIRYEINKDYGVFCCVNLSYDHDKFFICDVCGNIIYEEIFYLETIISKKDLDRISNIINNKINELNLKLRELAVAIPGQYNSKTGVINFSSRINKVEDQNILEILAAHFPNTEIIIKNDIRFAIKGDKLLNERSKETMTLYIQIGYGIVSAIVNDGKVLSGYNDIAGEIGTTIIKNGVDLHTLTTISALIDKRKDQYHINNMNDYFTLYQDHDDIKEDVYESARVLGKAIDLITNAVGCNNVVLLGEITRFGSKYLNIIQDALNLRLSNFKRSVTFLYGNDLIENGMIEILKDNICHSFE